MDWATTDALMERALVNWRSVKDRAPDGTPEMTLSLNICGSAMAEAEEAYGLYVRGKRKPSSIPRPEEVFFNPSCKRKPSSIHHARGRPEPSKDEEAIDAEDEEKVTGGSDAIDAEDEKKVIPTRPSPPGHPPPAHLLAAQWPGRMSGEGTIIAKTSSPTIKKATKQSQVIGAKARELPLARRLVNAALEEELAKTCS